jgi:signal transduction histidine kinase
VFIGTGGYTGAGVVQLLIPLGLAAAAYFLVSSGLVSVAIALEKGVSPIGTWMKTFSWSAVSYVSGWTFAVCLICLLQVLGPMGVVLGVPPCWMMISFYRTHREKLAEQASHIREIEGLNEVLENKVAERTRELKDAMVRIEDANRTLQATNEELTAANKTKSEFLAAVSHELRTPLNAIIGFSELISDPCYGDLGEQQEEFLKAIHDSGEHLLVLINDILDLSKIEAGKMEARKCSTDLAATLREAASMLQPEARAKRIVIREEFHLGDARGVIDPGMFREVLINLMSNAVKFTPEAGEVVVRAGAEGRDLVIEVEDNGIGISPSDSGKIFQEFYQVDGSYSREYGGTGLGLALVKKMMEMHDGTITVDSVPGEGS